MSHGRSEFTFHQCLGKGGFGEVYLATARRPGGLEREVAVKVLKEGLANEGEAVRRLTDEGRMLAFLNHPCILRVDDLHRVRGRVALVTEYIPGIDLARCTRRPDLLPPKVVLGAAAEVCDALHCAWSTPSPETGRPLQLIHRDIKPENVRIGVHGQIKLLDFGIARTTEMVRSARTVEGDVPFTPGYAAPEAYTRGEQSPAGDIYALGVTLYRLIHGERLYQDLNLGQQMAVASFPDKYAVFLRERLSGVTAPRTVLELLVQMLAHDPDRRPAARQVREAAESLMDDLSGPNVTRWARSATFPPPSSISGASLTGQTILEDARSEDSMEPPAPRGEVPLRAPEVPSPVGPPPVPPGLAKRTPAPAPSEPLPTPAPAAPRPTPPPPPVFTPGAAPLRTADPAPVRATSLADIRIRGDELEPPPPPESRRRRWVLWLLPLMVALLILAASALAAILWLAL